MPKLYSLPFSVEITDGFPGIYKWSGGTSYYLHVGNKKAPNAEIHFSLKGGDNSELADFHITRSFTGSNVGIWFKAGGVYSNTNRNNPNLNNLPSHKRPTYENWWKENEKNCQDAAVDFWNQLITNSGGGDESE